MRIKIEAAGHISIKPIDTKGNIVGLGSEATPGRGEFCEVRGDIGRLIEARLPANAKDGIQRVRVSSCDPDHSEVVFLVPLDVDGKLNGEIRELPSGGDIDVYVGTYQYYAVTVWSISSVRLQHEVAL